MYVKFKLSRIQCVCQCWLLNVNQRKKQALETREKLISVGIDLFGSQGYSSTSAEQIVSAAKVTRGALYHHFNGGKLGLFEAVVERMQQRLVHELRENASLVKSEWGSIRSVFSAFFEFALNTEYRVIALQDAPSILGVERWREIEYDYSVAFIVRALESLMKNGVINDVSIEPIASLIFGASCEAALLIAASDNKIDATQEALDALELLMSGLKK